MRMACADVLQSGSELADTEHELQSLRNTSFSLSLTHTRTHTNTCFLNDRMRKSLIKHPTDALTHIHTGFQLKGRGKKQCTAIRYWKNEALEYHNTKGQR
ncbi:hypothetical protein CHARACLAT_029745 [Characodon lateralis]|uniref:Uncharacterized protein n=1 Tax=Characodon lateralis TaxID=208331 RepID=A0ABU7D2A2_9TELE|nr:hypothetical protein [Characodon lateralis]